MMIGSMSGGEAARKVGGNLGESGRDVGEAAARAARALIGRRVLNVGTDLVEVDEMRAVLERQPRFAERVFTEQERAYCGIPADCAERYAVRFAAKEAVLKALGVGLNGSVLTEIEVVRDPSGSPSLRLTGRAAALAEEAGVRSWLITLTHTRTLAHAFVAGLYED
ncbi:holo-ACP synthase [Streptomyces sp. NPDC093249]|uniref:holo-ACP synthase n=1 Tax=unclassified Streptomyces TaxID=2593676 RepID=UPI00344BF2F4